MGVTSLDQLYQQPWLGASWEGYVIEQTLASLAAAGKQVMPYYFRTTDGQELDLVLDHGHERWAIEVNLTSNPTRSMLDKLMRTAELVPSKRAILVCRVARKIENDRLLVTNLSGWLRELTA